MFCLSIETNFPCNHIVGVRLADERRRGSRESGFANRFSGHTADPLDRGAQRGTRRDNPGHVRRVLRDTGKDRQGCCRRLESIKLSTKSIENNPTLKYFPERSHFHEKVPDVERGERSRGLHRDKQDTRDQAAERQLAAGQAERRAHRAYQPRG